MIHAESQVLCFATSFHEYAGKPDLTPGAITGSLERFRERFAQLIHMAQFLAWSAGVGFATIGTVLTHNAVWERVHHVARDLKSLEQDVPGLAGVPKVGITGQHRLFGVCVAVEG